MMGVLFIPSTPLSCNAPFLHHYHASKMGNSPAVSLTYYLSQYKVAVCSLFLLSTLIYYFSCLYQKTVVERKQDTLCAKNFIDTTISTVHN